MKDATGKEIVFGKKYGYSQNNNGVTSIRIGIAEKVTPSGLLKVKIITASKALYNDAPSPDEYLTRTEINVKANILFPVYD